MANNEIKKLGTFFILFHLFLAKHSSLKAEKLIFFLTRILKSLNFTCEKNRQHPHNSCHKFIYGLKQRIVFSINLCLLHLTLATHILLSTQRVNCLNFIQLQFCSLNSCFILRTKKAHITSNISSSRSSSPDTCHCLLDFIVLVVTRLVWLDKTSLMLFEIKQKHGQNHKMTASCNLSLRCRFLEI